MMPDNPSAFEIDHIFGDIGRDVSDPFQTAGHGQSVKIILRFIGMPENGIPHATVIGTVDGICR